jgi:hypothetical protein
MATRRSATVTLTREHRDAIYEEINGVIHQGSDLHMYFADAEFDMEDRDWIRAFSRKLPVCLRLLDQLGWQQRGDRNSYTLDVDDDAARFMQDLDRHARDALEDDRVCMLEDRAAGRREEYRWRWGVTFTDQEWAEKLCEGQRVVDRDLDVIDAARIALAAYREAGA